MSEQVTIKLPNGVELKASPELAAQMVAKLGMEPVEDGIHYNSDTKGYMRISEMQTTHIRNAVSKIYRQWASDLSKLNDMDFLLALRNGPSSKTMLALVREMTHRITGG